MTTPIDPNDKILWDNYVRAWENYRGHGQKLRQQAVNLKQIIEYALGNRQATFLAIQLMHSLSTEERKSFFSQILEGASSQNPYYTGYRDLVFSFPKEWLIENIEQYAESLIEQWHDIEVYGALMGLYTRIDKGLAIRLAQRAIQSDDADVHELGTDVLKDLVK